MSQKFKVADTTAASTAVADLINWEQCVICQDRKNEVLQCPANLLRADVGSGYKSLAENLVKFRDLGQLPKTISLSALDDGQGIASTMLDHKAKWHKSCALRYNNTKLKRASTKRKTPDDDSGSSSVMEGAARVRRRSSSCESTEAVCIFCGQSKNDGLLHQVLTMEMDSHVRASAILVEDNELLGKLSLGDMVALEHKYHKDCLSRLHNRARSAKRDTPNDTDNDRTVSGIVFAELVMYIEDKRMEEGTAPVFKLTNLADMYGSRIKQLGGVINTKVHTTRLKLRLLAQFPDLQAHLKGTDILLAFQDDIGPALAKACEKDMDNDAVHLARAAQIVRRHIFDQSTPFNGSFQENCQENSVQKLLLALVNMILEGPNIKDQSREAMTPAALSIAQLFKYQSRPTHRRKQKDAVQYVRHNTDQETPLPIYVGLMLHAQTRKRELVDRLFNLGLSIPYDRVLRLSADMGNSVCQRFENEQVVCPPSLRGKVFTTAAVDNIDHNPSSTTAKDSFHGTGISLIQHANADDDGVDRGIVVIEGDSVSKTISHLPHYYTDVPPVESSIKGTPIPATRLTSLKRNNFQQHRDDEYGWMENSRVVLEGTAEDTPQNISWAAYHANKQQQDEHHITPTSLLPLFHESAHTVAMIRHSMNVVKIAVEHLNEGQVPVLVFDQPLYAIAKQIQWKWPAQYSEDKFVIMFGGLHIELAALKTAGDWLQGSGWPQVLEQAGIATAGTADSFLRATHITRTRRAHQVTAAALYILQRRAFDRHCQTLTETGQDLPSFDNWCHNAAKSIPQFQYWATVMALEICILVYVRSLREANFTMYLDALTELIPWFFALDHTHYSRWIAVHLLDMSELHLKHPEVYAEFGAGHFTVQKSKNVFSAIPIDQAHEQNNACIKGDGGAVGLTDNPNALRRWMVAGPEVSRVIGEFDDAQQYKKKQTDTRHHDQTAGVQKAYAKDVTSLVAVLEELGNPFEEESKDDLIVLDTKEMAAPAVVETVRNALKIGKDQFELFTKDRLIDRSKSLHDVISRNKLPLFNTPTIKPVPKSKQALTTMKGDMELFSRMYIGCQTRDGNLDDFFQHENRAYPPSLSEGGNLRLGSKSDLLNCMEELSKAKSEAPVVTSVILDGAAIVQMMKPGTTRTFDEYANVIFKPYISSQLQRARRLDLVWDSYVTDSLKSTARAKRGMGVRRRVVGSATTPANWQNFLRVDSNKTELFQFLSMVLVESIFEHGKELVVTVGENVESTPLQEDLESLGPCNHEEADSRMFLHVAHASRHGHEKILVRTVDTDVVVLAVAVAQTLPADSELWLAFGTGTSFRYLAAHELAVSLGPDKSRALPMFHALTGCDTVSAFLGHGKRTAWATWKAMPELTNTLLDLSSAPDDVPDDGMRVIERFVILMYDRTSTSHDVNLARKKIFGRKNSVQSIPPTRAALEQHVKRAVYQGGHVWGQLLLPQQVLPSPTRWGWVRSDDNQYQPFWTTLPEASRICYELVSCGCKKGCNNRCKCKKAALKCSGLCWCEGGCVKS